VPCASIKNTDRQNTKMQIKNAMLMKIDAEVLCVFRLKVRVLTEGGAHMMF